MLKFKSVYFILFSVFIVLLTGCVERGSYIASYPSGTTYYEGVYGKGGHDYYRDENEFHGGTAYYPKGANY